MMNVVVLIGRLTADPEARYTVSGTAVTNFRLAVERPFTNRDGEREADFINIVCWRKLAEIVAQYMRKGRMVAVHGRIETRSWENQEGERRFATEVVAENVRFLDSPPAGSSGGREQGRGGNESDDEDLLDEFFDDDDDDEVPFN